MRNLNGSLLETTEEWLIQSNLLRPAKLQLDNQVDEKSKRVHNWRHNKSCKTVTGNGARNVTWCRIQKDNYIKTSSLRQKRAKLSQMLKPPKLFTKSVRLWLISSHGYVSLSQTDLSIVSPKAVVQQKQVNSSYEQEPDSIWQVQAAENKADKWLSYIDN